MLERRKKEAGTAAADVSRNSPKIAGATGVASRPQREQQHQQPARSDATATVSSTKHVTAAGAKVTTVSSGAHPYASMEPETVTITANPATAVGVSFGVGGVVRQVAPKGQAASLGVREGWRLTYIVGKNEFSATATTTPKAILEVLAAARKQGKPYALGFTTPGGSGAEEGHRRGSCDTGGGETNGGDSAAAETASPSEQPLESESKGSERGGEGGGATGGKEGDSPPGDGADGGHGDTVGTAAEVSEKGSPTDVESSPPDDAPEVNGDGEVTLMYEMYDEKFPIKDGSLSSADIDETYCLSFVMPKCTLHLGPLSPSDRYARESDGTLVPYVKEDPPGTFHGLVDGGVYWVYVSRDNEEEKQDRERMKKVVQGMKQDLPEGEAVGERKDDGRNGLESCSCVYGNPCVDEYGCRDWHSRYAVAKANGWKGF